MSERYSVEENSASLMRRWWNSSKRWGSSNST
jgi:hypothetical protein